jgi:hypothetical protein
MDINNFEHDEVVKSAQLAAEKDWSEHATRYLTRACRGTGPSISGLGFYPRFYPEKYSDERDDLYCEIYNKRVQEFIEEQGLPEWAPLSRLPSRTEALSILEKAGTSFENYSGRVVEKRTIGSIVSNKGYNPKAFARDESRQVLLIAGDVNISVGEIDIIDLENTAWMGSYQYLRKHVLKLPWDRELVVAK